MSGTLLERVRRVMAYVRFTEYDTTTDDGRARERYRRAALTGVTGALARGTTIFAGLVTVPLCVHYLGKERYGMWLTISSLFSFAYVADLGITSGLQLAISSSDARDNREEARRYVSSAIAILIVTCTIGAAVLGVLDYVVNWPAVFNVKTPEAIAEAAPAAVAFGATWLINTLVAVVLRVSFGYQDGYVTNMWTVLGESLSIVAVIAVIHLDLGLPPLVYASVAVPAFALVLNGIQLFGWRKPWLRPSTKYVQRAAVKRLLSDGGWYLMAGLGYNAVFMSSDMLLAQMRGASTVPEFGVPLRVVAAINLMTAVIVNSIMPAYAEAAGRGDHRWVKRALGKTLSFASVFGVVSMSCFVVFGGEVVRFWVGSSMVPSFAMLLGLGVWGLVLGLSNGLNQFVQATGGVRANGLQWLAAVVVAIPTQAAGIHFFGPAGVPLGLLFTEVVCRAIPGVLYYWAWSRRLAESSR